MSGNIKDASASRTLRKGAVLTVPGMGSAASCRSLAAVSSVKAVGIQKTHSRSGEKGDFILYFLPNIPVLTFNGAVTVSRLHPVDLKFLFKTALWLK